MDKAQRYERLLHWHNRPVSAFLMHAVSFARVGTYVPYIGYVINSPELAVQVLTHRAFRSTGHGSMDDLITRVVGPNALINTDGAAHHHLRSLLNEVFAPRNADGIAAAAGNELLDEMRDELRAGKVVDIAHYSQLLVARAICGAIGIRVEGVQVYEEVAGLASQMTKMLGLDRLEPSDSDITRASCLYEQLSNLVFGSYAKSPSWGTSSVIAKLQSEGWSFEQARGLIAVILIAGNETVTAAIPRITALLVDSGQLRQLAARRELLANAIVEGLRLVVPSPVIVRSVAEDVSLLGIEFRKGRRVIVVLYNALKQGEHFAEPHMFMLERRVEPRFKHLCFGAGAHFCIGFALAHREIAAFLEALLDVPGEPRIISRKYPRGMNFPAYISLRIRFDSAEK